MYSIYECYFCVSSCNVVSFDFFAVHAICSILHRDYISFVAVLKLFSIASICLNGFNIALQASSSCVDWNGLIS